MFGISKSDTFPLKTCMVLYIVFRARVKDSCYFCISYFRSTCDMLYFRISYFRLVYKKVVFLYFVFQDFVQTGLSVFLYFVFPHLANLCISYFKISVFLYFVFRDFGDEIQGGGNTAPCHHSHATQPRHRSHATAAMSLY